MLQKKLPQSEKILHPQNLSWLFNSGRIPANYVSRDVEGKEILQSLHTAVYGSTAGKNNYIHDATQLGKIYKV